MYALERYTNVSEFFTFQNLLNLAETLSGPMDSSSLNRRSAKPNLASAAGLPSGTANADVTPVPIHCQRPPDRNTSKPRPEKSDPHLKNATWLEPSRAAVTLDINAIETKRKTGLWKVTGCSIVP
jgi:hypothetical protein